MKKLKLFLTLAFLFVIITSNAFAQPLTGINNIPDNYVTFV